MPITEVMIPPWVRPESPEQIELLDDQSVVFQPAFSRNAPQIQTWADPRWMLRRQYTAMRLEERAMLASTILEARGKAIACRLTPVALLTGSFQTSELISNGTFVSSTQGYAVSDTTVTLSVSQRVMRINNAQNGDSVIGVGGVSVTPFYPYVLRMMLRLGRHSGTGPLTALRVGIVNFGNELGESAAFTSDGYKTFCTVPTTSTVYPALTWYRSSVGDMPNDFLNLHYLSFARCLQVDVGANKLSRSEALDDSYWSRVGLTAVNPGSATAPNGASSGESLVETNSLQQHYIVSSTATIPVSAVDLAFSAALKAGTRTIGRLSMQESAGTQASAWFHLNSGTVLASSAGTNWASIRSYANSLGNGWWECSVIARKTNAAAGVQGFVALASSATAVSYTGNSSHLFAWRPTIAESSVPVRLVATTSGSDDGGSPNGGACHIKGAPASINGLLLPYDWVELVTSTGSELKQVTAALNTDASGKGYLQFRPGLSGQMLANAPIIVQEPFGKFRLMNGAQMDNRYGNYLDTQLEFTEVY